MAELDILRLPGPGGADRHSVVLGVSGGGSGYVIVPLSCGGDKGQPNFNANQWMQRTEFQYHHFESLDYTNFSH